MELTYNKKPATLKHILGVVAVGITVGGIVSGAIVALLHNSELWNIDPTLTLVFVLLFLPSSGYILSRACFKAIE